MGLTFSVGNPDHAFIAPFAARIKQTLAAHFGPTVVRDSEEEPYYSQELGWSGWRELQERALQAIGADQVPHFLSMEAWSGCYVPADTEPGSFKFDDEETALDVASLPALVSELENVGAALGLPVDNEDLKCLAAKYQDDDLIDSDMDIQTYAQLLLAAHEAERRRQVLWIVK